MTDIQNLREAMDEMFDFICDLPSGTDGFECDFDAAFKELGEVEARMKWIPVTERLPSEEEWLESRFSCFLCWGHKPVPGGVAVEEIRIIPYTSYNGWKCEGIIITHWMPLPEEPKEVE